MSQIIESTRIVNSSSSVGMFCFQKFTWSLKLVILIALGPLSLISNTGYVILVSQIIELLIHLRSKMLVPILFSPNDVISVNLEIFLQM